MLHLVVLLLYSIKNNFGYIDEAKQNAIVHIQLARSCICLIKLHKRNDMLIAYLLKILPECERPQLLLILNIPSKFRLQSPHNQLFLQWLTNMQFPLQKFFMNHTEAKADKNIIENIYCMFTRLFSWSMLEKKISQYITLPNHKMNILTS